MTLAEARLDLVMEVVQEIASATIRFVEDLFDRLNVLAKFFAKQGRLFPPEIAGSLQKLCISTVSTPRRG